MSERKELYRKAHAVIDALTDTEPRPATIDNFDQWWKAVRNRVRAENWATVIEALETDPTTDLDALAASIRQALTDCKPAKWGKPDDTPNTSAALPVVTAEPWTPLDPETRQQARERIAAIREKIRKHDESEHRMSPEQVIGNSLLLARRLMRAGVRIHNRPQAVGAAAIGSLSDNGFTVVETRYLRIIEQGNDDLDVENNRLREQLAALSATPATPDPEGAQQ